MPSEKITFTSASGAELAVLAQEGLRLEVDLADVDPVAVDALLVLRGEVAVDGDVGCVLMVALP